MWIPRDGQLNLILWYEKRDLCSRIRVVYQWGSIFWCGHPVNRNKLTAYIANWRKPASTQTFTCAHYFTQSSCYWLVDKSIHWLRLKRNSKVYRDFHLFSVAFTADHWSNGPKVLTSNYGQLGSLQTMSWCLESFLFDVLKRRCMHL